MEMERAETKRKLKLPALCFFATSFLEIDEFTSAWKSLARSAWICWVSSILSIPSILLSRTNWRPATADFKIQSRNLSDQSTAEQNLFVQQFPAFRGIGKKQKLAVFIFAEITDDDLRFPAL